MCQMSAHSWTALPTVKILSSQTNPARKAGK